MDHSNMTTAREELVRAQYEFLFGTELLDEIISSGKYLEVPADEEVMDIGQKIDHFPLILSGSLKVMTEDKQGRELLLYYLETGDTCAMTLNAYLKNTRSKIRVVAEEHSHLVLIPIRKMEDWIIKYPDWRKFVFDSYNTRFDEMLEAIDSLAFQNFEERLLRYLRDKAMVSNTDRLKLTHYQIATDLNSSRVVVSRMMKKLERDGKLKQHRNCIELLEKIW